MPARSRRTRRRLTGLAAGTPVITGTADAAAEAISAGLANPGDLMVMYGSSIFFILKTDRLYNSPHFWGTRFLEPDTYAVAGGMSTAGSLTRWFRDNFAAGEVAAESAGGENAYAALAELAAASPPGARGLVALPYFAGERTPIFDPDAKGLLVGLTLSHTRGDVYRALLESVGYGIRHNLDAMRAEGMAPARILAVGGGTLNRAWMQMVSDIAGIEQHIPAQQIGAAYGDAFLAGVGIGMFGGTRDAGTLGAGAGDRAAYCVCTRSFTRYSLSRRYYETLAAPTGKSITARSRLDKHAPAGRHLQKKSEGPAVLPLHGLRLIREYHRVFQLVREMVADIVAEDAFEFIAAAAGDGGAARVAFVAADLDAMGAQGVKGKVVDGGDGLGHVAFTGVAGAQPVADLKLGHAPVDPVQAAGADHRVGALEKEQQHQVGT